MKLDKETKEFISGVVRYAVAEAIKQANEDAKELAASKVKPKTTFDQRRAKAGEVKAAHDREATASQ